MTCSPTLTNSRVWKTKVKAVRRLGSKTHNGCPLTTQAAQVDREQREDRVEVEVGVEVEGMVDFGRIESHDLIIQTVRLAKDLARVHRRPKPTGMKLAITKVL